MTGADLRRARAAKAARLRYHRNIDQYRATIRTAKKRSRQRQREVLLERFGVRGLDSFFNLWLKGEIQIVKEGEQVQP